MNEVCYVTIKQYIDQLRRAEKKNMKYHFGEEMCNIVGIDKKNILKLGIAPAMKMAQIFEVPAATIMEKVSARNITDKAIRDLTQYLTECGMKAYSARVKDKKGMPLKVNGIECSFLQLIEDSQDIFVISINDFLDQWNKNNSPAKTTEIVKKTEIEPEFSDPLAVMAEEMGTIDYHHIPE